MRLTKYISLLFLSSSTVLVAGCSSDSGSSASTDINIAGLWTITETSKDSNCDDQTPLAVTNLRVEQDGTSSSVAVTDIQWNETFNGTLNDHTLTWAGSYEETANGIDGRTTLNPMTADIADSCNTLTGEAKWTWTAIEGTPYTCSGTTTFTGERDPAIGCGGTGGTTATTVAAPVSYSFEDGTVPAAFVMSGDANWVIDAVNGSGGSGKSLYAAGFPSAVGAKSCVAITVSNSANISFDYKVSSELNFDFVRFYVNGVLEGEDSGEVDWTNATHSEPAAGTNEFKWCYEKDDNTTAGSDTAWIDTISID